VYEGGWSPGAECKEVTDEELAKQVNLCVPLEVCGFVPEEFITALGF
jgi:hypothetical protein